MLNCFIREHWLVLTKEDVQMGGGGRGGGGHNITVLRINK